MDKYRAELRERLRARIAELEAAIQGLQTDAAKAAAEVRRISRQLRRASGRYGFPDVTEAAGATELADENSLTDTAARLLKVLKSVGNESDSNEQVLLIVEDDPAIARALEAALAAPDRRILTAGTVAQATELLAAHEVVFIVLDLFLPDDDGRRLLSSLRQQQRSPTVPVFVTSGPVGAGVKAECYRLGAENFFDKPVAPSVLAAAVTERLARSPGAAPPAPAVSEQPEPRTATTHVILLAEDDELITSVVLHRLGREGFEVRDYPDGKAALAAAEQFQPDLVILDDQMPAMGGFELLSRLRALVHYRDVPVIMLTSLGGEGELARAFELGANDYIVKPFSPAELVSRVRRLVTG